MIFLNGLINIFPNRQHHSNTIGYYHPSQYPIPFIIRFEWSIGWPVK